MKKQWLAGVLAAVCALGMSVSTWAASTPTISNTSSTETRAAAYQYQLFDPENSSKYLNEVYCSLDNLSVMADNGKYYKLNKLSELTDTADFTVQLKSNANATLVKSMRVEQGEMQKPDTPSIAVKLTDNAVLDRQSLSFTATYTAKQDVSLSARESTAKKNTQVLVKKGAKLVFSTDLMVDYSKLIKLDVVPRYAASLDSIRRDPWPTGVSGDVITPETNQDSDYTWSSIGRLCAEVDGNLSGSSKLSTLWTEGALKARFVKGQAFIRSFADVTVDGSVTLTLTNPFVTLDGEESLAHSKLYLYEYKNGKLTNVTKNFRYTTDSDGNGAFYITTSQLGTYIISDVKASV